MLCGNSLKCNYDASQRKLYYAHIMLNCVMGFSIWPKDQAHVVNWIWQIMAACSCNASIQQARI